MHKDMPKITKSPLSDFVLSDEFRLDKIGLLIWYDGPLECHWIKNNGDDYLNSFLDCDVRALGGNVFREIIFKIEPKTFLDFQQGKFSFLDMLKMSDDDYFIIDRDTTTIKIWKLTFKELSDLYGGLIPLDTDSGNIQLYDKYFEDEMKPYLINKIRNNKINSLNL